MVRALSAVLVAMSIALTAACSGDDDDATTTASSEATDAGTPDATESTDAPTATRSDDTSTTTATTVDDPTTTTSSIAPTTAEPPDTTEAPTTTVDPTDPVDWFAIVDDLFERRNQAYLSPSLDAIAEVCLPESGCEDTLGSTMRFMLNNDVRAESVEEWPLATVELVNTLDDAPLDEATIVTLRVIQDVGENDSVNLVRPDGSVFEEIAADDTIEPFSRLETLQLLGRPMPGRPWKLVDSL
jgi:hypothetical protein